MWGDGGQFTAEGQQEKKSFKTGTVEQFTGKHLIFCAIQLPVMDPTASLVVAVQARSILQHKVRVTRSSRKHQEVKYLGPGPALSI